MPLLANNNRLEPFGDHFGEFGVCHFNEWAGGISNLISSFGPALAIAIRGSMGGNDDVLGRSLRFFEWCGAGPLRSESRFDSRIVGQLPQNGSGVFFKNALGGFDGLSDAEAHAGVFRDEDVVAWSGYGLHFSPKNGLPMWRGSEGEEKFV